jgi:hypothetical protein
MPAEMSAGDEPVEMDVDLLGAERRIDQLDLLAPSRLHGTGRTLIQMQDLEHARLPQRTPATCRRRV